MNSTGPIQESNNLDGVEHPGIRTVWAVSAEKQCPIVGIPVIHHEMNGRLVVMIRMDQPFASVAASFAGEFGISII
jgi:hypothetical protein